MDSVYSINIERAVLSSILFNPEELEDVLGVLKPKDFYLPAHKKIFEVMVKLHNDDMPIDEEFIRKRVDTKDVDDSILLEILSANPITNTLAYVREIKDGSVKRELASLATTIKKVAIEEEMSANEALDTIQGELYKISTDSATSELKDMQTVTGDTLSYIEKMKKMGNKHLIGETTGFEALDRRTTGFNAGDLIIIAARPAMGKTALVLNMALKNVEQGKGVIFFSLEMPAEQLMLRMLAAKTSIPLQNLRKGDLDDQQWSNLSGAFDDLNTKKLFVDDGGSININQLRARVRKLAQNESNNIRLVIIDYLQLMQGTGNKDRHQEVSDISRGLKMLAREMKIPIIALSQLNRGLENRPDKRPMLSDLRESGAIEQDADIVSFIYRPEYYKIDEWDDEERSPTQGQAEFIVAKHRNGGLDNIRLKFIGNLGKFDNLDDFSSPFDALPSKMNLDDDSNPFITPNLPTPNEAFGSTMNSYDDDSDVPF